MSLNTRHAGAADAGAGARHVARVLVAGGDAELDQSLGDGVDAGAELGEGPALSLEGEDLARAPLECRALRQEPDRVSVAPVSHDDLLARARGRYVAEGAAPEALRIPTPPHHREIGDRCSPSRAGRGGEAAGAGKTRSGRGLV